MLCAGQFVVAQDATLPEAATVTMRVRQAHPEYPKQRADLLAAIEAFNEKAKAFTIACHGVDPDDAARMSSCRSQQAALQAEKNGLLAQLKGFNAGVEETLEHGAFKPSGNGMVGGTGWIVGYNVPKPTPELIAKSRAMLAEQERLAGNKYSDAIDFDRYNFVIGIAAETDFADDLLKRVGIGDEFSEGQFSADKMPGYAALAGRSFGELGCHSNGAMVCLAALRNKDVKADNVVLYGPQITETGLKQWQALVDSGQVKSVTLVVNKNDPVPPLSLGFADYVKSKLPGGSETYADKPLLLTGGLIEAVEQTAPAVQVHVFSCAAQLSDPLHCHGMATYNAEHAH
jgi:hypothetical protein